MSISPAYTIHQLRDDMFKVVAFKGRRDPDVIFLRDRETEQHYDVKLDSNFSRARSMVLQYALCNPWDYFFTGTLDQLKFDRYDLDTYSARLMQFIRDQRKKYNSTIQVLLVPEHHKDGAWHIHGMINGLPVTATAPFESPAPRHLIEHGFLNWPDYMNKFGFCSLAPIRDPIATAFYLTKYISKDISQRSTDLGKHLYFHSRPLRKAQKASDVYYYNSQLENYCTHEYDFCKTGYVEQAPWHFPYLWDGAEVALQPMEENPVQVNPQPVDFKPWELDPFYEQLKIDNFRV